MLRHPPRCTIFHCTTLFRSGRVIITCVCCIPCPGYCFCAARCRRYITQLVHCCPVTGIRCCGCSKRWRGCTFYRRVCTRLSDESGRASCWGRGLISLGAVLFKKIRCIPCPGYCFCTTVHCCYICKQVHGCSVTGIRCCGCSKRWCPCTLDGRVCSGLSDSWWCSISYRDRLRSCCRVIITCVRCIPCPGYCFCTTRCHRYITQLVHCCSVTGIRCCGCSK